MIRLHQYPPAWGLPSLSPFCLKVETFLRLRALPYQVVVEVNPRRGPKGKMPFLEEEGRIVPDSSFILEYLSGKYGAGNDGELSPSEKALGLAFQRLAEESLYWAILYSRWGDETGWRCLCGELASLFPFRMGPLALRWIRRELLSQARKQGMGRHTREEIYSIGKTDLASVAVLLGEKDYFLGARPGALDATLYAFLQTILKTPFDNPLRRALLAHGNLVAYCARMERELFPECVTPDLPKAHERCAFSAKPISI